MSAKPKPFRKSVNVVATDGNGLLCPRCCGAGFNLRMIKSFSGKLTEPFKEFCPDCQGTGRKPEGIKED